MEDEVSWGEKKGNRKESNQIRTPLEMKGGYGILAAP